MKNHLLPLLFGFLAPLAAGAGDLHLVAQGVNSVGDVAPIYSCLAYQGCEITRFTLGKENRIHIYTTKSVLQVRRELKRCDLSAVQAKTLAFVRANGEVTAFKAAGEAEIDFSPAILSAKQKARMPELLSRTHDERIPFATRAEDVLRTLDIQTSGYRAEYGDLGEPDGLAVRGQKTIKLNHCMDTNNLITVVRHEFDHALQYRQAAQCAGPSTFSDRLRRERAAYLNDIASESKLRNERYLAWFLDQIRRHR